MQPTLLRYCTTLLTVPFRIIMWWSSCQSGGQRVTIKMCDVLRSFHFPAV